MEATTDPNADGPKLILTCGAGHKTVLTVTAGDAGPMYLDSLCTIIRDMGNSPMHGGCQWVDPDVVGADPCGARMDATWTADTPTETLPAD